MGVVKGIIKANKPFAFGGFVLLVIIVASLVRTGEPSGLALVLLFLVAAVFVADKVKFKVLELLIRAILIFVVFFLFWGIMIFSCFDVCPTGLEEAVTSGLLLASIALFIGSFQRIKNTR